MQGIPTFLSNQAVVIKRTPNGYTISESMTSPAEQCPVFETWDACVAYLGANFAAPAA